MQPTKDRPLGASLARSLKGGVDIVDAGERAARYVFSNIYEIGAKAKEPYRKIAVAKNGPYVIECVVAEGVMPQWRVHPHGEFSLCMEGGGRGDFTGPRRGLPPGGGGHPSVPGEDLGYIIVREG